MYMYKVYDRVFALGLEGRGFELWPNKISNKILLTFYRTFYARCV